MNTIWHKSFSQYPYFMLNQNIGPFLNDIGDNANNVNNGNPKSPMSFKYRHFGHSIFPLLFKNEYFNNPKSTLLFKYDTHFSDVI